jgi:hypothetical protein
MDDFIVFGRDSQGQEVGEYRDSLEKIREYISQLDAIHLAKLWIKDGGRNQIIRWDLFMNPTWYDPTLENDDLLKDWFQCLSRGSSNA